MIVSGGAEGIGFAVAKALGREGMNVVITDISPDTLATAEADLSERGNSCFGANCGCTN